MKKQQARKVVPPQQATRGAEGTEGDAAQCVPSSLWDFLESIEAFAGHALDTAVYYPEDDVYLLERESEVVHYDVHVSPGGTPPLASTLGDKP